MRRTILKTMTIVLVPAVLIGLVYIVLPNNRTDSYVQTTTIIDQTSDISLRLSQTPTVIPTLSLQQPPTLYEIPLRTHVFQTFNNCGPASLSMQLTYFDINISQQAIGSRLRPYQNSAGDNDDKSTTLEELAQEAERQGLIAFHRPAGSIQLLKQLIAADLPVVIRTWTAPNEDIGHYRVVRGYNDATQEIIQDDSLQGKDLRYSYDYLQTIWQPFNYEFLVLTTQDKEVHVRNILGERADPQVAWQYAKEQLLQQLDAQPDSVYTIFNLSIAEYYVGNYQASVDYFEQVESKLPFRTLWYQIEPILAYQQLDNRQRVFQITNNILQNGNRAFTELYLIRGEMYVDEGNIPAARQEFQQAVQYNQNSEEAQQALNSLQDVNN